MSDLEEKSHLVAQNIDVLLTHDGREAANKASEFSRSMLKLMEPLSLPENRTEDDWRVLSWLLEQSAQTESRCIGKQTDENGVEREVWQHTFTPEYWKSPTPIRSIDAILGPVRMKANARMRREERAHKLKRRQRRAAQRRYNRGRA